MKIKDLPNTVAAGKKIAIYTRVACFDPSVDNNLQAEKLKSKYPGLEIIKVYEERGHEEQAFQEMLKDVKAGEVTLVLMRDISRLSRKAAEIISKVKQLSDAGTDIWFDANGIYLEAGKTEKDFILMIIACFAEEESERKSFAVKSGWDPQMQHELRKKFSLRHDMR